ncbi:MAG: nucleotidyltransferase domain-containing protein [Nanoarchaeota archaeon]|nr:nucleotidyltransferase domain-containing protein [Nanoarchaeota archaeon]
MQKTKNREKIKNLILFGSVAREEAGKDSDVDIFVDVVGNQAVEREISQCLDDFRLSVKYKSYWQMLDVKNEIRLTIGELKKWKELQPSLIANGILLYGKFQPRVKEGKHRAFFIWENIKPNAVRVLLNKQLFGYKQKGKLYLGLLQKYGGEKLGKGCIVVPLEHATLFLKLFRRYNASVKIKKVLEYSQ